MEFGNLDKKIERPALQKVTNGVVVKKKAGRPRKPNLIKKDFKIDKGIHAKLVEHASSTFSDKSSVVNRVLAEYFTRIEYKQNSDNNS